MNAGTRVFAFTLIVSLLFVPALTRVYQRLERSASGTLVTSNIKSAEAPPDKLLVGARPLLTAGTVCDVQRQPGIVRRPAAVDVPVSSGPSAPPDALRAPPRA